MLSIVLTRSLAYQRSGSENSPIAVGNSIVVASTYGYKYPKKGLPANAGECALEPFSSPAITPFRCTPVSLKPNKTKYIKYFL